MVRVKSMLMKKRWPTGQPKKIETEDNADPNEAAAAPKKRRKDPKRWSREVRYYQGAKSGRMNVLPAATLSRWVRATANHVASGSSIRCSPGAIAALRSAAQEWGTELMRDANQLTMHRKSVTMNVDDLNLAASMKQKQEDVTRFAASVISPS